MKFKSDIELQAGLRDGGNDIGTAGQILSSTGSQTNWIDQSSIVASEAKLVFIECKNTSGGTISKGTPVYQTGTVGATDVIEIDAADASDEDKMAAIGLLQADLANNAFGKVVITGELLNITTSPIDGVTPVTGDTIYVKSGGGLTLTKPTGVNFIQNIGLVGKVSGGSAGSITVSSIMRSNDVPTPLYIDHANQRLGIGIETPDSTLHVASPSTLASQSTILKIENTADQGSSQDIHIYNQYDRDIGIKFETLGGTNYIWQDSNGDDALILSSGGNNRANNSTLILEQDHDVLIPNGNVGIGVSPAVTLHVDGFARLNGGLQMNATNAQIYQILDSDLRFGTNNTERMRIDNTGNVGIGTTSPIYPFSLESTTTGLISRIYNTNTDGQGLLIRAGATTSSTRVLQVASSNDTKIMTVNSNGNVGIGTTSPSTKLEVNGDIGIGRVAGGYTFRETVGGGERASIKSNATNELIFSYGASTEAMRITSAGNVGIGTTSPSTKLMLEHNNDGAVGGTIRIRDRDSQQSANQLTGAIEFESEDATTPTSGVSTAIKAFAASATGGSYLTISTTDVSTSTLDERMRITSNGNVGIGTTSPSQKLEVSTDNYNVSKFTGNTDDGTGYVGAVLEIETNNDARGRGVYLTHRQSTDTANSEWYAGVPYTGEGYSIGNAAYGTSINSDTGPAHKDQSKLFITEAGNVGIGTTSPLRALHVSDSSDAPFRVESTDSTTGIQFKDPDGNNNIYYVGNGDYFYTSANVGIGTTSPSTKLEVAASATTSVDIAHFSNSNGVVKINHSLDGVGSGKISILDASNNEDIRLSAQGNSWFNAGNVGIGTTSPDAKLEIIDTSNPGATSGSVIIEGRRDGSPNVLTLRAKDASAPADALPNGQGPVLRFQGFDGTDFENMGYIQVAADGQAVADGDAPSFMAFGTSADGSSSPVERMRITNLGGISFGSTGTAYGTSGQVLTSAGNTTPTWTTPTTGTVTGTGLANRVAFWTGASSLSGNSNLWWDNTNGHLGIGDTTPGSKLKVTSGTAETSIYTVDVNHVRNDADVSTNAVRINMDLSGADTTTADRTNSGLFIDLDSSANGDATHEHRIKGVNSDVRFSGFSDSVHSGYFLAESNYLLGKTAQLVGVFGNAVHDASSTDGGVSNMYGVYGTSSIQDLGDVDNAFGGYFSVTIGTNRGDANVGITKGVEGHIDIDKANTITYGEMMAVSGIIDNNEGTVPNFGSQYLFKGDYQGTKGSNAWGIYCEGDKHYFANTVGIGNTSPDEKLEVSGSGASDYPYIKISNPSQTGRYMRIGMIDSINHCIEANGGSTYLTFKTNATERMRIATDGNVGIGTTSPANTLNVNGDIGYIGVIGQGSIYGNTSNSSYANMQLYNPSTGYSTFNNQSYGYYFLTGGDTKMTILNNGNVGIGTDSPTAGRKLDVHGDIELTEDLFIGATGSSRGEHKIKIGQNRSGNGYAYIDMIGDAGATSFYNLRIIRHNSGANALSQIIHTGTGNFEIKASDGGDIILNSSGSIGISQTSPSYKLDVAGDGRFTSTVTAANFILSSDERLKENVEKVCNNKVKADWKTFELKTEKGQKRYGVIAQELEKTNPEFVREDSQGFKSVAYIDLLIAKIAELEARLEKLER